MAIAIPPLQVGGMVIYWVFPLNVISNLLWISYDLFALRRHLFNIIIIIIIIIFIIIIIVIIIIIITIIIIIIYILRVHIHFYYAWCMTL